MLETVRAWTKKVVKNRKERVGKQNAGTSQHPLYVLCVFQQNRLIAWKRAELPAKYWFCHCYFVDSGQQDGPGLTAHCSKQHKQ